MEESFVYYPENVCSREFHFVFEDGIVKKMSIVRGCPGNTQAVCRLIEGRKIEEVIPLIEGIRCPGSRTHVDSCPNEVAKALRKYLSGKAA